MIAVIYNRMMEMVHTISIIQKIVQTSFMNLQEILVFPNIPMRSQTKDAAKILSLNFFESITLTEVTNLSSRATQSFPTLGPALLTKVSISSIN